MKTINFTKEEAKKYMVSYHMFYKDLFGHDGIKHTFEKLMSIQYDPLDVVGRNSDLVLQARINDYKRNMINEALYDMRYLIDGWDKMMGIYQVKDFPYMSYVRENRAEGEINTMRYRNQVDALEYQDEVLALLKEGAKSSADIKLGVSQIGAWGQRKSSSATLDYLFHKGLIGVESRKNTQKKYNLIERLIDNSSETFFETVDQFKEYYIYRRILSMGLVWNKSGVHWSGLGMNKKTERTLLLNKLLEQEKIIKVSIAGIDEDFYIPDIEVEEHIEDEIKFIAPLDNFIWDRQLIEELFDFEYRWEVYTPLKKRRYGYYVLPMLKGTNLVGRIEFEKHRRQDELVIKNIWWENKKYTRDLNKAITKFKKYLKE